ncbi:AT-hook motif nuclear-localized protein 14-like [Henckelia pumila]|uniref:AT-hook motif nuclear-localized protein 14-like n=1 Tax=Henckelia pumila TaxID=405737 RepID=UPI003C6DD7E7
MEANINDGSSGLLASYYHPQLHHQTPPSTAVAPSNGLLYPHSVPSSAIPSTPETVKRKRGRPRKYGTPEQAAAAKRTSSSASSAAVASARKKDAGSPGSSGVTPGTAAHSSKKSQLAALCDVGQSFSPHIITLSAGEDVNRKIMVFMKQSKCEICIISASGSVSHATLCQHATSGGSVSYEGKFDILSLSGSFTRAEGGERTGGLSVCLSSSDGQIIGGGVSGPLMALGPIQIIVGTFLIDPKRSIKGDAASRKLPSPVAGTSAPVLNFQSPDNSPHQTVGSGQFYGATHDHAVDYSAFSGTERLHSSWNAPIS